MIDGAPQAITTKGATTVGEFYTYTKDATTGVYTFSASAYTTASCVANAVGKTEVVGATVAGHLFNATGTVAITN